MSNKPNESSMTRIEKTIDELWLHGDGGIQIGRSDRLDSIKLTSAEWNEILRLAKVGLVGVR